MPEIDKLFEIVAKHKASDLHLKVNAPPILRISGSIRELDSRPLGNADLQKLIYGMLSDEQIRDFERDGDLDCAYAPESIGRFRINVFRQRGNIGLVARRVNSAVPSFEDLNLPPVISQLSLLHQGLVILCGVTGSGKSTTIAAMLEHINRNRRCHIITVEDPIEYTFQDRKSFINQREVGIDVIDFSRAIRAALRQDPDVLLIGEMRDAITFKTGIEAASTGHLVFGTLHSSTVPQTFGRIYDIFPPEEREGVRKAVMFNVKGIVCQKLAPTKDGKGRVPVHEIMVMNATIQKLIEKKEEKKVGDVIRIHEKDGMCDFNQSLARLVKADLISEKTALEVSHNPEQLKMQMKGIFIADSAIVG